MQLPSSPPSLPRWLAYVSAPVAVALAYAAQLALRPASFAVPFASFYLAVTVATWLGGVGPGLLAVAGSALLGNWTFIAPMGAFSTTSHGLLGTGLFVVVASLIALMASAARRQGREQARLAEALRRQGERLVDVLMQAPAHAVVVRAADLRVELANPLFRELAGRQDLVGQRLPEALPELYAQTAPMWRRVLETGETVVGRDMEVRAPGAAGLAAERWFNYAFQALRDDAGRVTGAVALAFEVTHEVRARRELDALNASLSAQRAWLELVVQRIPVPVLLVEPGSGRALLANEAADGLWGGRFPRGTSREEYDQAIELFDLAGRLVPREQRPSMRAARGEEVRGEQYVLRTPRGEVSLLVFATQVPPAGGLPGAALVSFQDVTALKHVEQALGAREQEYRTLAESMPQIVWTAEADGRVDYANGMLMRYAGAPVGELAGETWGRILHPDDRAQSVARWREAVRTGGSYDVECRLRGADGTYRWFLVRAAPLKDEAGRPRKWFGSATDIEDTRRSQQQSRLLAEASAVLGSTLEVEGALEQVAQLAVPALADWLSVDLQEEDGRVRRVVLAHPDPERLRVAREVSAGRPPRLDPELGVGRVLDTGRTELIPWVTEEMLGRALRHAPEMVSAMRALGVTSQITAPLVARGRVLGALSLVMAESGRHQTEADVQVAEDLARRLAFAVDNARLYADAQEAVRLRDEFLSVASHELKTPLTVLQLQLQMVRRRLQPEAGAEGARPAGEVLDGMGGQVRKLSQLVSGLLDVSRISSGQLALHPEPVDLAQVVREVAQALAGEAERVGCRVTLAADAPVEGRWDRLRLEQVVTNLMSNALKYGPGKPVRLEVARDGGQALLRVRDEGIGISPEALGRIFGRFERAVSERHYGGLGLGLYITRQIVEAHGGTVTVESAPGEGALFEVRLPLEGPAGA